MPITEKPERAVGSALQSALNASGFVGTWETDLETGTVYPSGVFADLIGVDPESAAAGVPIARFLAGVHADDRERVAEAVRVAHRTAGRFESEFRTLGRDGSVRWVTARGQVEKDAEGHGFRCLGVALDVTDTRYPDASSDHHALASIHQIIDAIVAVRASIVALGSPILKTMIDILLMQLASELKDRTQPLAGQRVH